MRRVVVADAAGTSQRMLAAPGAPVDVVWSPDGTRLLVTVSPSPDAEAREVDILRATGGTGTASAVLRLPRGSERLSAQWAPG